MKSWHYVLIAVALVAMGYAYWVLTTSGRSPAREPSAKADAEPPKQRQPPRRLPRREPLRPVDKKEPVARTERPAPEPPPHFPPKRALEIDRQVSLARDSAADFIMKLDAQIDRVGDEGLAREEWLPLYQESLEVMEELATAMQQDRQHAQELTMTKEAIRQRMKKLER